MENQNKKGWPIRISTAATAGVMSRALMCGWDCLRARLWSGVRGVA